MAHRAIAYLTSCAALAALLAGAARGDEKVDAAVAVAMAMHDVLPPDPWFVFYSPTIGRWDVSQYGDAKTQRWFHSKTMALLEAQRLNEAARAPRAAPPNDTPPAPVIVPFGAFQPVQPMGGFSVGGSIPGSLFRPARGGAFRGAASCPPSG